MLLVDSYCHLDRLELTPYGGKLSAALDFAATRNVSHFLNVSISLDNFPAVLAAAEEDSRIYASVGVHPNEQGREPSIDELCHLADHPRVVAIGETGLDYFRSEGELDWQRDRFRTHIAAAKQTKLPLIIHCREARSDTLEILQQEGADEVGGVMHCFVEDWATAEAAMEMGFYISISGIVTFRSARELQEVAKRVPLERLMVETDSPYLAPVPHRGKPNQPAFVRDVAEFIAELRGIPLDELASTTSRNFFRLFSLEGAE